MQIIEQGQERLFILTRQDKVIAFFKQRDEIKSMLVRGGLQTKSYIRFACMRSGLAASLWVFTTLS